LDDAGRQSEATEMNRDRCEMEKSANQMTCKMPFRLLKRHSAHKIAIYLRVILRLLPYQYQVVYDPARYSQCRCMPEFNARSASHATAQPRAAVHGSIMLEIQRFW
jgi:hypothetical protein